MRYLSFLLVPLRCCVVHHTWNVLARVPKKESAEVKKSLHFFGAACLENAKDEARRFGSHDGKEFPSAAEA
jgi:transposase-like protein